MSAIIDLLHHRRSSKKFGDKAPNQEQLSLILKAGLRAPDHGKLKPYRFFVLEKSAMPTLEKCLKEAVVEFDLSEKDMERATKLPKQAPMIIGVVAHLDHHSEKVPAWEQMLTAGCAAYAMQLAAHDLGFDSKWVTRKWVDGSALRSLFQCREKDKIIALLLIGSPAEGSQAALAKESEAIEDFVQYIK